MVGVGLTLARMRPQRPRPIPLELPLQSNPGRYGHDGPTRLLNCYAERRGREGKSEWGVYAIDGLKSFATLTDGGQGRGVHDLVTEGLAVSARQLYSVDPAGGVITKGGIPGDGFCTFATNRALVPETIIASEGGDTFLYKAGVLTELNIATLVPPNSVDFLDGYTLYFAPDGTVTYSGIEDATTIGGTFQAEGSSDGLCRGIVHDRTIYLLGLKTTELWENVGDQNNPFQRLPGAFFEIGCGSGASAAKANRGVLFLTDDGGITMLTQSGEFRPVSTHAVEQSIQSVSDKTTIEGSVDQREGREFYVLSAATFTWVLDLQNGLWHERESYQKTRWRGSYYMKFAGKRIVQDFEQGLLYEIDPDTYDEAGDHLLMICRFPVHAWPEPISLKTLDVDMIPGVGLNVSDLHSSDPQLMLKVSRNGGTSYPDAYSRPIGKIGQHRAQTHFDKLGTSDTDGFVLELSISADVIKAIVGLNGQPRVVRR